MKFENLLIKTENNITTISINRPKKLNALNIKTFELCYNSELPREGNEFFCIAQKK